MVYVARRLEPNDPVRILATHRTGAPEPAGLDRAMAIERVSLGPMSVGGIHRIVRQHAGVSLARPRLLEIHAVTFGNPLHAIELARAVDSGSALDDGSLASLFRARIEALPDRSREALVLIGASADRSTGRLERGVGRAIRRRVRPRDRSRGRSRTCVTVAGGHVRPVHPLVTHVAYEDADPRLRRTVHQALARTATDDEERALHLGRAADGPDAEAADLIEAAARDARRRGVRSLSATLFESAARITPPDRFEETARRWLAAASAWFDAGDTHRVEGILEPVIDTWPAGARRAEARWRLGIALDEAGRWPEANDLWRASIAETDDRALVALVQCSLAITAMYTDSMPVAIDWAAAAAADAERSGDPAALARSLAVHAFILAMAGRSSGQALMDRALEIEATIDDHLGEWSPAALAAEVARHTGDIPAALRHYAAVLERATTRGDANVQQWAAFGLATSSILAGEIARASELADLVLDIAEQTDVMRIPRARCGPTWTPISASSRRHGRCSPRRCRWPGPATRPPTCSVPMSCSGPSRPVRATRRRRPRRTSRRAPSPSGWDSRMRRCCGRISSRWRSRPRPASCHRPPTPSRRSTGSSHPRRRAGRGPSVGVPGAPCWSLGGTSRPPSRSWRRRSPTRWPCRRMSVGPCSRWRWPCAAIADTATRGRPPNGPRRCSRRSACRHSSRWPSVSSPGSPVDAPRMTAS